MDEERFGDGQLLSHFHHTDSEGHSKVTFVVLSYPECKVKVCAPGLLYSRYKVTFTFDPVHSAGQLLRAYFVLLIAPAFSFTLFAFYIQYRHSCEGT